jgi:hypothetical protein
MRNPIGSIDCRFRSQESNEAMPWHPWIWARARLCSTETIWSLGEVLKYIPAAGGAALGGLAHHRPARARSLPAPAPRSAARGSPRAAERLHRKGLGRAALASGTSVGGMLGTASSSSSNSRRASLGLLELQEQSQQAPSKRGPVEVTHPEGQYLGKLSADLVRDRARAASMLNLTPSLFRGAQRRWPGCGTALNRVRRRFLLAFESRPPRLLDARRAPPKKRPGSSASSFSAGWSPRRSPAVSPCRGHGTSSPLRGERALSGFGAASRLRR